MPNPLRTQFVIADGARARWVIRREDDFVTTAEHTAPASARHHPLGVVFEGSAGQRFGVEEGAEAVRRRKIGFAEDVAAKINVQASNGSFDRLVIAAPARMLSAIDQRLAPAARAKLVGSLAKDLTKTQDHELGPWLGKWAYR